jgi:DNA invertase Pin-like site-specific DNA recombinase
MSQRYRKTLNRRRVAMTKRVALYLRVSTTDQTVENQRRELAAVARRHGWRIVETFKDEGISGAKGRDKRPGYDRLLDGIARREFDMVAAWSVDRLGRSLQELVGFLGELHSKRIDLYLHQQGLDTSTPAGKAMFQMLGVFAEFERTIIVERVKAGLSRARAQGKRLGRPTIAKDAERQVRKHLVAGMGIVKAARTAGVGVSATQRVRASLTPAEIVTLRKARRSSSRRSQASSR